MLNYGQVGAALQILGTANARAYTELDSSACTDNDEMLLEFLEDQADLPNFFIMRDKQKKKACKALADLGLASWRGAVDHKDYKGSRRHITETINEVYRVMLGSRAMDIIMDGFKPVFLMIKDFEDLESGPLKDEITLLVKSSTLHIRKTLLAEGLYDGRLM
jgi:hypothetical protein